MVKLTKMAIGIGSAALVAAGLAGCGSSSPSQQASGTAAPLIIAGDFANPTMTENFNPLSINHLYGTNFIYEPLYVVNLMNGHQTPWLATSYKWANATTLQFTIRSGVKWNNGRPFSAKDVVYTFNLIRKYPALDTNGVWNSLASVTSSGNVVTFRFSHVNIPEWYYIATTPIVSEYQFSRVPNPVTFTDPHPVGMGPFMVSSFTGEQYDLKDNPYYWQKDKIKVPEMEFRGVTGNTSVDEWLVSDQVDWAQSFIPNMQKLFIDKNPATNHSFQPPSSPWTLFMNLTKWPFNQLDFRKALAYDINRKEIVSKAEYNMMTPDHQSLLPPTMNNWLNPQLFKRYDYHYDPAKAAKELAKMGLKRNSHGQLLAPNGQPITLTLEVPAGWTDIIQDGKIMVDSFKKLGITVDEITPSPTTVTDNVQTGSYEMALQAAIGVPEPYFVYYEELDGAQTAPIGHVAPSNYERWNNPTTNKLLSEFARTTNPQLQKKIMYQLQKIVLTQVPVIPYDYGVFWFQNTTTHYTGWPTAKNPYAPGQVYAYPDNLLVVTHLRPVK